MTNSRSIQPPQCQQGLLSSNRLPLVVGILLGHACLLGGLLLLPQEKQQDAEPLPMMMVDLQPPVPLAVGAHNNSSRQAVTAAGPEATLTDAQAEGSSSVARPQQSVSLKTSAKSPAPDTAKPVAKAPVAQQETSTPASDKIASTSTASEHAITTRQAATSGASSHKEASAPSGAAIASTSGSSGAVASSPQFGAGYLSNPAPDYPELAREMGEEGKVLLHVLVTPEGRAKKVKLHRTSGSDSLDDAAARAVRKWRFVPAKLGEQAVEAWVFVPIVFKLD